MSKKILLISGSLCTSELWKHQRELLSGFDVEELKVIGSESISELAKGYKPSNHEKVTVIAFSMGGYIALELFRFIPETIERLVIINGSARELCQRGKDERLRSVQLIEKGKFDFLVSRIFKNSIFNADKREQLIPLLQKMAFDIGAENYKKQLLAMINKHEQSFILSEIQCPVLIISGRQDTVMPSERAEHLHANIKNSKLVYLEDCGHIAVLEKPDEVNQILKEWL